MTGKRSLDPTAAVLTTKGDLLGYSTVAARVPVGADGTVLTADSTNADGVSYQAGVTSLLFGLFGDGSDGAVTFDGTATIVGTTKVGSVYTATRDLYYTTAHLTTNTTLNTNGFRIFCQTLLNIDSGCTITRNGNNGITITQGNLVPAGTMGASASGGAGSTTVGTAGGAANPSLGGSGGAGGASTGSGTGGGAAGGAATAPGAVQGSPHNIFQLINPQVLNNFTLFFGGAGGGGGNAAVGSNSGGGGGGGGSMGIYAYELRNNGTISALGGNGGPGAIVTGTGSGGGGGGGGGFICILSHTLTGTNNTYSGAANCTGGAAGARSGTGANGVAGSNGNVFIILV